CYFTYGIHVSKADYRSYFLLNIPRNHPARIMIRPQNINQIKLNHAPNIIIAKPIKRTISTPFVINPLIKIPKEEFYSFSRFTYFIMIIDTNIDGTNITMSAVTIW